MTSPTSTRPSTWGRALAPVGGDSLFVGSFGDGGFSVVFNCDSFSLINEKQIESKPRRFDFVLTAVAAAADVGVSVVWRDDGLIVADDVDDTVTLLDGDC